MLTEELQYLTFIQKFLQKNGFTLQESIDISKDIWDTIKQRTGWVPYEYFDINKIEIEANKNNDKVIVSFKEKNKRKQIALEKLIRHLCKMATPADIKSILNNIKIKIENKKNIFNEYKILITKRIDLFSNFFNPEVINFLLKIKDVYLFLVKRRYTDKIVAYSLIWYNTSVKKELVEKINLLKNNNELLELLEIYFNKRNFCYVNQDNKIMNLDTNIITYKINENIFSKLEFIPKLNFFNYINKEGILCNVQLKDFIKIKENGLNLKFLFKNKIDYLQYFDNYQEAKEWEIYFGKNFIKVYDWYKYFSKNAKKVFNWIKYFKNSKVAKKWNDVGFNNPEDAYKWYKNFDDDPEIAFKWYQNFDDPNEASEWSRYFLDAEKAKRYKSYYGTLENFLNS